MYGCIEVWMNGKDNKLKVFDNFILFFYNNSNMKNLNLTSYRQILSL